MESDVEKKPPKTKFPFDHDLSMNPLRPFVESPMNSPAISVKKKNPVLEALHFFLFQIHYKYGQQTLEIYGMYILNLKTHQLLSHSNMDLSDDENWKKPYKMINWILSLFPREFPDIISSYSISMTLNMPLHQANRWTLSRSLLAQSTLKGTWGGRQDVLFLKKNMFRSFLLFSQKYTFGISLLLCIYWQS